MVQTIWSYVPKFASYNNNGVDVLYDESMTDTLNFL